MKKRLGNIDSPEIPDLIPICSQWLSGQGAGAWFYVGETEKQNKYNIKRYNPKGNLDCDRIFEIENNGTIFDIKEAYQFLHISHCSKCRIKQNEIVFVFNYKGE